MTKADIVAVLETRDNMPNDLAVQQVADVQHDVDELLSNDASLSDVFFVIRDMLGIRPEVAFFAFVH